MDAVEEVKSRLNIEDVVGEYVELKRSGHNFKGLSPFTSERTPSFVVSPEKQIWHDFSSGKGGNVFGFVMEMEGLDFRQALELLARKAGVDLAPYGQKGRHGPPKERLYGVLEAATRFYQVQFSKHRQALEYALGQRGFSKQTALEWRLGYSPNTGTALLDFLKRQSYTDTEISRAGLSTRRYRGVGDMFLGRLMIPLQDAQGRVIGFTARLLADDPHAPKYINTPQTVLYDKSRHVYGLHLAKESIRKTQFAVLVEGNLDVISSHQAGVRQTVATAGTALTEHHLKTLGRFTGDVRLCFDADKAGLNAAERAIPIAAKAGVSLSIITLPSGKDPDELVRQDPAAWQLAIGSPLYALDWLIERYQSILDVTSAPGKRRFSDVLLPVVRALPDAVETDHYLQRIATIIGVSREALSSKYHAAAPVTVRRRESRNLPPVDKTVAEQNKLQDHLLALCLHRPELRRFLSALEPDMVFSAEAKTLLEYLRRSPDWTLPASLTSADDWPDVPTLRGVDDYCKILTVEYEELYHDLEPLELHNEAARLQAHLIEHYVKTQKRYLAHSLEQADQAASGELLRRAKALDQLLNSIKGEVQ